MKKESKERISADPKFKVTNPIKDQRPKNEPQDGKNSPWDFRCPQYDQRTSNFINAGCHFGVGINQPVGHGGPAKSEGVPRGHHQTMRVDEVG